MTSEFCFEFKSTIPTEAVSPQSRFSNCVIQQTRRTCVARLMNLIEFIPCVVECVSQGNLAAVRGTLRFTCQCSRASVPGCEYSTSAISQILKHSSGWFVFSSVTYPRLPLRSVLGKKSHVLVSKHTTTDNDTVPKLFMGEKRKAARQTLSSDCRVVPWRKGTSSDGLQSSILREGGRDREGQLFSLSCQISVWWLVQNALLQ